MANQEYDTVSIKLTFNPNKRLAPSYITMAFTSVNARFGCLRVYCQSEVHGNNWTGADLGIELGLECPEVMKNFTIQFRRIC